MLSHLPFRFRHSLCGALFAFAMIPHLAFATVNLKKVSIVDGNQIELLFDGKVDPGQVKTEFVRDNIQLSLSNASVYPAKVSMVAGSDLTKVFAYQYAPALVRARFTVKGDATTYANRLQVKFGEKTLTVKISASKGDQVAATASSALRVAAEPEVEKHVVEATTNSEKVEKLDKAEKAEKKLADKAERAEKADRTEKSEKLGKPAKTRELTGGKPVASPFRSIGMMLFVLGVFGLFVMFLKRMKGGEAKGAKAAAKGLGGLLNKLSGGVGGKSMIEVVATHHLAPKRSIVVVRVQDRMLVLGMTNDAVNLITEFRAGGEEGDADENIPLGDFAASLKKFENEESLPSTLSAKLPVGGMSKANLGDIAAAALGLAKPKPASAPRATAAASAYQNVGTGANAAMPANGGPSFSAALSETLKQPSVKQNIRAQIKDRVQGMKQL